MRRHLVHLTHSFANGEVNSIDLTTKLNDHFNNQEWTIEEMSQTSSRENTVFIVVTTLVVAVNEESSKSRVAYDD